tara:strand:+ start:222 stop:464 length:243 start_codon:yes stop_codon:yes gene_type:complete
MVFKNPQNDFQKEVSSSASWLWVFLFGPIYWAAQGIWTHCVVHLILALITLGLAHLIYPFFTYKIIKGHYQNKGWVEIAP